MFHFAPTMKFGISFFTLVACTFWSAEAHSGAHHHHHRLGGEEEIILPCNATKQHEKDFQTAQEVFEDFMADDENRRKLQTSTPIIVPVYVHIITSGSGGNIPDANIAAQIAVLNDAFEPHFQFQLIETNRVANNFWFSNCLRNGSTAQRDMKATLRRGGSGTLNIYTCNTPVSSSGILLGVATFPWEYEANPLEDGVVSYFQTFPGGNLPNHNLGVTTVHEAGHWLGLFHTFQNDLDDPFNSDGCGEGDYVDDTPAQAVPTSGCPLLRDTCASDGFDPIHNMMDYSDDFCKDFDNGEGITAGQFDRMLAFWTHFREGDATVPEPPPMETEEPGEVDVYIEFTYDRYFRETSWAIYNSQGEAVILYGAGEAYGFLNGIVQLLEDTYTLVILDNFGDGSCCLYGLGQYYIAVGGTAVASGFGIFTERLEVSFEIVDPNRAQAASEEAANGGTSTSTMPDATLCSFLAFLAAAATMA